MASVLKMSARAWPPLIFALAVVGCAPVDILLTPNVPTEAAPGRPVETVAVIVSNADPLYHYKSSLNYPSIYRLPVGEALAHACCQAFGGLGTKMVVHRSVEEAKAQSSPGLFIRPVAKEVAWRMAGDLLNFKYRFTASVEVQILDPSGRRVASAASDSSAEYVPTGLVTTGVYKKGLASAGNSALGDAVGECARSLLRQGAVVALLSDNAPPRVAQPTPAPVAQPTPVAPIARGVGERWAVVIGVSQYADSRIPGLRYAAKDADAFYDWLVKPGGGAMAPSRVRKLIDKEATYEDIRGALFEWAKQALEEDLLVIYFAGHASPESPDRLDNLFLLPYDVSYDKIASKGFPMWDIETALKRFIKARKVIVITDACHAGGVGSGFVGGTRDARSLEVVPSRLADAIQSLSKVNDGIAVMTASGPKQLSHESEKWGGGHGVFTHYLLKGLQGDADYNKDGKVTLGELIPYLSEQVRRETASAQSPEVAGKFDPALSLGR